MGAFEKKLHFDYYMQIDYSEPVASCHFTIKCLPQDTNRQKIEGLSIEVYPEVRYCLGRDSFGNRQFYGKEDETHDTFHYRVCGDALTKADASVHEETAEDKKTWVFRHPHGLNISGEKLHAYHEGMKEGLPENVYEKGIFLMHRLYQDFQYEKESTGMATTAEEAFRQGKGVCQDYAHILISLLHMENIPARYAAGMLFGEGASHAWVEFYYEGKWYGLDPTNDTPVMENYIRINTGRDAADCLINRGIMKGGGRQTQTIQVVVEEV